MTRPQRLLFLFASLVTFAVSVAGPSGAVSGFQANPTDLASMINAERAQHGLPPLTVEPILAEEAEAQSRRMSSSSQLYHSSSISSQAGPWERWAENVGTAGDVQGVHRTFMESPGHRANILGPDLTSMGVGIAVRPGGIYVTELFVRRPPGYAIRRLVAGGGATEAIRELSATWLFAEGATWPGFDEYLVLVNPSGTPAAVEIGFSGTAGPIGSHSLRIPAGGRSTVHVNDLVAPSDVAAKVTADRPIGAMRSVFVADGVVADGHIGPGAASPSTASYLPEGYTGPGFRTYLALFNPNASPATASVTYMTPSGARAGRLVNLAPRSRATVFVNDEVPNSEMSTQVTADVPIVVERTQLFSFKGIRGLHNAGAYTAPTTSLRFAEGYTGDGFQEYLLLQNPAPEPVTARVTLVSSGAPVVVDVAVPPLSRATLDVNATVGPDREVGASIDAPTGILAERVMYFARPGYQGGSCALGSPESASAILPEGYTGSGFQTYVLLANFGDEPATASVTYLTEAGPRPRPAVTVAPQSRVTIVAADDYKGSFGVTVTSDRAIVVEEAEYFRKAI